MRTGAPWPRDDLLTIEEIEEILRCIVQAIHDIGNFAEFSSNPTPFEDRVKRLTVIQKKIVAYVKERKVNEENEGDGGRLQQGKEESQPINAHA